MLKSFSLVFTILLIFSGSIFSQTKQTKSKSTIVSKDTLSSKSSYLTVPFNTNVESLKPQFLGHNASIVFGSLVPLAIETEYGCGKFEKRQDCQERLNKLYDKILWKGFTARDLLAFSIPIDCDYSADAETFWCSNFLSDYMWSHKKIDSRTYIGQNAFGVKKIIQYSKFENIIIEVDKTKPSLTIKNIEPDEAKTLSDNLRLLIIGETLQPFAKRKKVSYKPTLDDPSHIEGDNKFIVIELKEVWVYDFITGKVFEKKKFEE